MPDQIFTPPPAHLTRGLQLLLVTLQKKLAFVFLPAISGDSRCSALVPLTNTVLLLGAPMLPMWRWVKIATYLNLEPFLLIGFMLVIVNGIYFYHYYYYAIIAIL
jgi:hypothetical protein